MITKQLLRKRHVPKKGERDRHTDIDRSHNRGNLTFTQIETGHNRVITKPLFK